MLAGLESTASELQRLLDLLWEWGRGWHSLLHPSDEHSCALSRFFMNGGGSERDVRSIPLGRPCPVVTRPEGNRAGSRSEARTGVRWPPAQHQNSTLDNTALNPSLRKHRKCHINGVSPKSTSHSSFGNAVTVSIRGQFLYAGTPITL